MEQEKRNDHHHHHQQQKQQQQHKMEEGSGGKGNSPNSFTLLPGPSIAPCDRAATTKLASSSSSSSGKPAKTERGERKQKKMCKMVENLRKYIDQFLGTFDRREWTIISTLMVANFINTITFNCMDAFFPKEAHNREISTGDIGIIIGMYQLSRFLMAPFAGKYVMNVGPMFTFLLSLFITAGTAIGFGLLTFLPNGSFFFWASFGVRIFQALGRTCFVVSSLTITAQLFPNHVALLGGLLETFAGVGHISGPALGSALFELGGFILPNFTMGVLMAITGCAFVALSAIFNVPEKGKNKKRVRKAEKGQSVNGCARRNTLKLQHCSTGDLENPYINEVSEEENSTDNSENASKISCCSIDQIANKEKRRTREVGLGTALKYPGTWLIMSVIALRGIACSFYQAPLPEHLALLNSSALLVGAVYTVMSISYFLTAPLWGILVQKFRRPGLVTLAGLLLAILSTLLMGPFPLLPIDLSIPLVTVSFAILGLSAAAMYIPVFQQCTDISRKESEDEDSTRMYACLFGFVQSASTLGSFAGNTLGGFGAQKIGFPWTCSIVSAAHFLFAVVLSAFLLFNRVQ